MSPRLARGRGWAWLRIRIKGMGVERCWRGMSRWFCIRVELQVDPRVSKALRCANGFTFDTCLAAVPLTHLNLLTTMRNICNTYEFTPHDRGLLVMPLFHGKSEYTNNPRQAHARHRA